MAFQPGLPGSQFPSDDALIRRIQDLERDMRELRAANPFAPMGMTPNPNGVTFGGSVTINGNLAVPSGSITNAALQAPVYPQVAHADASGFSLSTTMSDISTVVVSVPVGYTRALVTAISTVSARNSTSGQDWLGVGVSINGTSAPGIECVSDSMATTTAHPVVPGVSVGTMLLTGLSGSFPISARAHSRSGWAADSYNVANIDATVLFLR